MSEYNVSKRLAAEFLGTALLLATVVGSGIMADKLSGGNDGVALLANSLATGAILYVLITIFGPISGAHFNPAVTAVMWSREEMGGGEALAYVAIQIVAAISGVLLAHAMFDLAIVQASEKVRTGGGQWLAEGVATFGLILTILGTVRFRADAVAMAVGLYITAAYWFTASTSFANPAVTIARSFTNTFAGIAPGNAGMFIGAQFAGAALGFLVGGAMFQRPAG